MTSYYKIGELSKLYGIGTDSLRYYEELGILSPKRGENGYRLYSINDIVKLNLLRDLRGIGFSVPQIKKHLDSYSVKSTLLLMEQEIRLLKEKQKALKELETELSMRFNSLKTISAAKHNQKITVKQIPKRRIIKLSENVTRTEDVDYLIQKLKRGHEQVLYIIGNSKMGSTAELSQLERGEYSIFDSVFCMVPDSYQGDCDFLPGGTYLTKIHKGPYYSTKESMLELYAYSKEANLQVIGSPIELYLVDNYDTGIESELVTELQLQIE